jgi:hypothetical protein
VALEGTRRLGFRLIGRRSDRQSVHAVAITRYSLAQPLDIFQNGEGRSPSIVLDRIKTIVAHINRQIVFWRRHG